MKAIKLFFVAIFVFVTLGLNGWGQDNEMDKDNYGVIIGKIIDEDTKQPVDEQFAVIFVDQAAPKQTMGISYQGQGTESDKTGYFRRKWRPGSYFIYLIPMAFIKLSSGNSKYTIDPNPYNCPNTRLNFKVEKGKITKLVRKAYREGRLKISIVNQNGSKINFAETFKDHKGRICITYVNDEILFGDELECFSENNEINGERTIRNIFPGQYTIKNIRFEGFGYGSEKINALVMVNKNQTAEFSIVMDLTNHTGVEGRIIDQNGNPIAGVEVTIVNSNKDGYIIAGNEAANTCKEGINIWTWSDNNGYYKIFGLLPGNYQILFNCEKIPRRFWKDFAITIENNIMKRKDLQVDIR